MIGYTMLGTTDLARAKVFYDAVFEVLGVQRLFEDGDAIYWGRSPTGTKFAVTMPSDGQPASVGNGVMIALRAESPEAVDSVHRVALSLGASDEGAPGPRGQGSFYGGYFRDLDGNKLSVFHT